MLALPALEWFDSKPERTVANMVDSDSGVLCWVRLHIGELPILWNSGGQQYNPDLIIIETGGDHWVVEVKMDKEMQSEDVLGKREAAKRWANYVTADREVGVTWRYLLVSEADVETARALGRHFACSAPDNRFVRGQGRRSRHVCAP